MTLHGVLFPVLDFTEYSANKWLQEHRYIKLKPIRLENNYWRALIHRKKKDRPYYSKKLPNGVILVFQD